VIRSKKRAFFEKKIRLEIAFVPQLQLLIGGQKITPTTVAETFS
jgi:hypothetical protein